MFNDEYIITETDLHLNPERVSNVDASSRRLAACFSLSDPLTLPLRGVTWYHTIDVLGCGASRGVESNFRRAPLGSVECARDYIDTIDNFLNKT